MNGRSARLRRSDSEGPGITRTRCGGGFRYRDAAGRPVTNAAEIRRLRELVVPPAWQDVWICPWPNGHIQAMGTDSAGRRQYLYHQRFREQEEAAKHDHVLAAARTLPELRSRVAEDLAAPGLTRERVPACAARLLDLGFFRIGNKSYRRDNDSYGLTTLLKEHASCRRGEVRLTFPAKSAKEQSRTLVDGPAYRALCSLMRRSGGGPRLFVYRQGQDWHEVHADDLNTCLRECPGTDLTAKDFRTWHATVLASVALAVSVQVSRGSRTARKRAVTRAVREVSEYLGNTPAVCRASYINPRTVELFEQGRTIAPVLDRLGAEASFGHPATQGEIEAAVLRLLDGGS
ncbi:DNA topoisomerase IB [Streptomyces sp. ME02-8801-2C]|uniref:DNA topoisomerase IB n=1 Tax=Streptomyces sp. ME02-8801-2C TaxID=3028680 RepID=UPI0029B8733D|nr:DNA topoisomerase IB [Streptomyces sp. ME02-8801-2C]MDX3457994.1 DNA topoisomerase IB [Streptomyces sp. ME02-8801-2C]